MLTVNQIYLAELEERKSKFISFLSPYSDFERLLKELKQKHPKARHFVYAYRYLNKYNQIVENSSDDGEPKGTSGKPTLATLLGKDIINASIITVRYFGGIKLGTGGLVRAYSDSANLVISKAKLIEYKKEQMYEYLLDYHDLQRYEYHLGKLGIKIVEKNFTDKVSLKILCDTQTKEEFEKKIKFLT